MTNEELKEILCGFVDFCFQFDSCDYKNEQINKFIEKRKKTTRYFMCEMSQEEFDDLIDQTGKYFICEKYKFNTITKKEIIDGEI